MTSLHSPIIRTLGFLMGLVVGLVSGAASADTDGPDFYVVRGVAQGDVLNIRAEPNPHARKVGAIPPDGACIRNLGCQGGLTFHSNSHFAVNRRVG